MLVRWWAACAWSELRWWSISPRRWGRATRKSRPRRFRERRHPVPPDRVFSATSPCWRGEPSRRRSPPRPPWAAACRRPYADSRYEFRFPSTLPFPLFRAFGDEIFAGEFAHLAIELNLVAGDLALVYDVKHLVLVLQVLDKRNVVAFHGAFDDLAFAKLRFRGPGQLLAVHLEIVGIVLHADLGIDGGGPLAGRAGGESGRAHPRQNE